MIVRHTLIAAGLVATLAFLCAPARSQADASLRLKCALIGGDLSEPAGILAFRKCLTAGGPDGASTVAVPLDARGCLNGLAHRRANADDIVCVPPARSAEIQLESLAAITRAQPGVDHCQQGFVWREATPTDHVCVPPAERRRVADENAKALSGFAYVAATSQNLCPYLDAGRIARDLGLAGPPAARSSNKGDCDLTFPGSEALIEVNLIPRAQFGFSPPGPNAAPVEGLGEKAIIDSPPGSDGLPTQTLNVLLGDAALTIQVTRASTPNANWRVTLAKSILQAIVAQEAKHP